MAGELFEELSLLCRAALSPSFDVAACIRAIIALGRFSSSTMVDNTTVPATEARADDGVSSVDDEDNLPELKLVAEGP